MVALRARVLAALDAREPRPMAAIQRALGQRDSPCVRRAVQYLRQDGLVTLVSGRGWVKRP